MGPKTLTNTQKKKAHHNFFKKLFTEHLTATHPLPTDLYHTHSLGGAAEDKIDSGYRGKGEKIKYTYHTSTPFIPLQHCIIRERKPSRKNH